MSYLSRESYGNLIKSPNSICRLYSRYCWVRLVPFNFPLTGPTMCRKTKTVILNDREFVLKLSVLRSPQPKKWWKHVCQYIYFCMVTKLVVKAIKPISSTIVNKPRS